MDAGSPGFLRGVLYFALAALPGLSAGVIIALCRSELYLDRGRRSFRVVTHRPWRRARTLEIPLGEYAGVRVGGPEPRWGGRHVVYLVDRGGEHVAIQSFRTRPEAAEFAGALGRESGLWVRGLQ
jgi:hypothetical protein